MTHTPIRIRSSPACVAFACIISATAVVASCAKSTPDAEQPNHDHAAESATAEDEALEETDEAVQEPGQGKHPEDPSPDEGEQAQAQRAGDGEVTDEDLDAFADAYLAVMEIQSDLEARLHAAESNAEAQEVQQQAIHEVRESVESTGMPFDEYGRIAQELQADPELVEKLEALVEEKRD